MKTLFLSLILTLGFTTIGLCGDPPPFNPAGPSGIPIDGGAGLLLASAVGYGIKKIYNKKGVTSETE